jgi:hypothetical protein
LLLGLQSQQELFENSYKKNFTIATNTTVQMQ